jgi:hypothetical protein
VEENEEKTEDKVENNDEEIQDGIKENHESKENEEEVKKSEP